MEDNRFEAEIVVLEVKGFAVRRVVLGFVVLEFAANCRNLEVDLVDGVVG